MIATTTLRVYLPFRILYMHVSDQINVLTMNKTSLLIIFFLVLSSLFLQAQTLKNSFGMALNRVHLNQINATGTSYSFQYSRYSQKKINSIQAKIGYLSIRNFATDNSGLLPEYNPKNGPCFTGDISFFHNFIKQKAHKLRLGIGPSVWYINDVYKPPIIKNSKFLNIIHVVSIVEEKLKVWILVTIQNYLMNIHLTQDS